MSLIQFLLIIAVFASCSIAQNNDLSSAIGNVQRGFIVPADSQERLLYYHVPGANY